jgi:hypothetical protein
MSPSVDTRGVSLQIAQTLRSLVPESFRGGCSVGAETNATSSRSLPHRHIGHVSHSRLFKPEQAKWLKSRISGKDVHGRDLEWFISGRSDSAETTKLIAKPPRQMTR